MKNVTGCVAKTFPSVVYKHSKLTYGTSGAIYNWSHPLVTDFKIKKDLWSSSSKKEINGEKNSSSIFCASLEKLLLACFDPSLQKDWLSTPSSHICHLFQQHKKVDCSKRVRINYVLLLDLTTRGLNRKLYQKVSVEEKCHRKLYL